jgi:hypothetical protein
MKDKRQLIPVAGLVCTMVAAGYLVAGLHGQATTPTGDFRNAAAAEIRDAQGVVVLQGTFKLVEEDDDDVERKATLQPTPADADAAGDAEVEYAKQSTAVQEVEFSARNLQGGASYEFVIDGVEVANATADNRGRVEVELEVRLPGAPQP